MNQLELPKDRLVTLGQLPTIHPAFTESGLRWMRFNNVAGFNKCIRKVGKRVLISLRDFEQWLEDSKEKQNETASGNR